jgi:hypothetical protein
MAPLTLVVNELIAPVKPVDPLIFTSASGAFEGGGDLTEVDFVVSVQIGHTAEIFGTPFVETYIPIGTGCRPRPRFLKA